MDEDNDSIVVIRKCQMADLESISRLQADWDEEGITPHFIPAGRGELIVRLNSHFLVAESSGEVIGFIYGAIKKSQGIPSVPEGKEYLEIDGLYVAPASRRKRVGGRLLDNLLEKAKDAGVFRFVANVQTRDVEAFNSFFSAHRFRAASVQFYTEFNLPVI